MTIKANTAEGVTGATNGLAMTSGLTAGAGDQLTIAGTSSRWTLVTGGFHGTYAYRVAKNPVEAPVMFYTVTTNQVNPSVYFKLSALPNALSAMVVVSNAGGNAAALWVTIGGGIEVRNSANTLLATLAASIRPGVWYRLDMGVVVGTTITNGAIRAGIFYGDQTTPIVPNYTNTATNTGTGALTNWQFGVPIQSASTAYTIDFDDPRSDDSIGTLAGAHGFTAAGSGVRFGAMVSNPGNLTADNEHVTDVSDNNSATGVQSPGLTTNEGILYTINPVAAGSLSGSLKALWVSGANAMRATLYQGATKISVDASHPTYELTNTEATYAWTNTPTENSTISDWNDLRMLIEFNAA